MLLGAPLDALNTGIAGGNADHGHPGVAGAEAIATVVSRVMLSEESTQGLSPEPPCAQFVAPDGP